MHVRPTFGGCLATALAFVLLLSNAPVHGLPRYGPIEVSGNVASQQLIRMRDVDQYDLVQQRNTIKLRVDYQMLDRGVLIDRIELPFVDQAKLFILYRGVYDSVYDLTPGFPQHDIRGRPVKTHLDDLTGREGLRFENQLREAYIDLNFKSIPLSFRLGRQQIVWGETDNFRMLDRVNALDMTWHLQQESWDEIRIPYWMIKGLYQVGNLGPLSDAFVESYWNPGDWYPSKRDFLPRPWSAPVTNPLDPLANLYDTGRLNAGTKLFRQGDYTRDPMDNSQVGVRFSAVTPQGVQFTLNYFYQRWAGDDGTNAASVKALTDVNEINAARARNELPVEAIAPYVHTAGFSLNYAEQEYTQAVFRAESVYDFGVPFTDTAKQLPKKGIDVVLTSPTGVRRDLFGVSKRDMWKGMIAFDRPTWIRPLNRNTTFLILGQFFWHYLLDNPAVQCVDANEQAPCTKSGQKQGFRGQFSASRLASGTGRAFFDKVRDWELLTTLATTTFYRGGKLVPFVVYVLDPVNKYNMEVIGMLDYFVTNNLILNLTQRYFINTTSAPVFESWGVAGINRGRSETSFRLTYQF